MLRHTVDSALTAASLATDRSQELGLELRGVARVGHLSLPREGEEGQGEGMVEVGSTVDNLVRVAGGVAVGQAVLLVGEAGVGNTSVVGELARRTGRTLYTLQVHFTSSPAHLLTSSPPHLLTCLSAHLITCSSAHMLSYSPAHPVMLQVSDSMDERLVVACTAPRGSSPAPSHRSHLSSLDRDKMPQHITDRLDCAGFGVFFTCQFQNCFRFCSRTIKNHKAKLLAHMPFLECKKVTFPICVTKIIITFNSSILFGNILGEVLPSPPCQTFYIEGLVKLRMNIFLFN